MNDTSVLRVIREARRGRESAATRIMHDFSPALRGILDRRIGFRLRRRLDADDILQSTFRSFFTRLWRNDFQLARAEELKKLLLTVALNKLRGKARFHTASRRDMARECTDNGSESFAKARQPATGQHDPAEAAMLADELTTFLNQLPSWARPLIEWRLEGLSSREIAERTGRAERSVRRFLARFERQARALAERHGTSNTVD